MGSKANRRRARRVRKTRQAHSSASVLCAPVFCLQKSAVARMAAVQKSLRVKKYTK